MPTIIIKTQAELDALPASFAEYTVIEIRGGTQYDRIVIKTNWGNAHAVLRENAHAELWGNAHAELWGNAHAELRENAHAVLWGNASVHAQSTNCTIELFGFAVAWLLAKAKSVKRSSKTARIITPKRSAGLKGWLSDEAVKATRGSVILFKRVSKDFKTQEGTERETDWTPGVTLDHPAWAPKDGECGGGKYHACSRTYFCDEFRSAIGDRYIALQVATKDLHAWTDSPDYPHKIAVRRAVVMHECDRMGRKIETVVA